MVRFDPRTKLFLLLEANLLLFFHVNTVTEAIIVLLFLAPFFLSGEVKSGLRFMTVYAALLLVGMTAESAGTGTVFSFIAMLAVGIRMLLPCLIAGAYAFKSTTPSELFCALRKCRVPEGIIITCAVVIRFFPTVLEDYRQIRDGMAMRSIEIGLLHPLRSLEYAVIPLLMNGSTVARDLSVAALTKGIGLPGKHTSRVQIKMKSYDWIYMAVSALPLVMFKGGIL